MKFKQKSAILVEVLKCCFFVLAECIESYRENHFRSYDDGRDNAIRKIFDNLMVLKSITRNNQAIGRHFGKCEQVMIGGLSCGSLDYLPRSADSLESLFIIDLVTSARVSEIIDHRVREFLLQGLFQEIIIIHPCYS